MTDEVAATREEELQRQLAVYRDIFSEITAKAMPLDYSPSDPDRIMTYRVPCGPIHRAAGKLGFQMFDGEAHMEGLRIALEEYRRAMNEETIPAIEEAIAERQREAWKARFPFVPPKAAKP